MIVILYTNVKFYPDLFFKRNIMNGNTQTIIFWFRVVLFCQQGVFETKKDLIHSNISGIIVFLNTQCLDYCPVFHNYERNVVFFFKD